MNTYPQSVREDIVVQNIEDETLLYNLKTNKALCLNQTSTLIWEMCDGKTSISEIAEKLGEKLKKPVTEELVWLAVDQLKKEDLLENTDTVPSNFAGLSRREVIRRVGFTSLVALPLISAIVAPNAVQAQSLLGFEEFCFDSMGNRAGPSACASGFCNGDDLCCVPGSQTSAIPGTQSCRLIGAPVSDIASICCSNSVTRDPSHDPSCPVGDQGWVCDPFP